jgi:competence protein ComEA
MSVRSLISGSLALLLLVACSQPSNPDAIRERTADLTAKAKTDAKAIAQGIKEGLGRDTTLDLNSASKEKLQALPTIDATTADRIIKNRPYTNSKQLVERRILTEKQYEKIASKVTAQR